MRKSLAMVAMVVALLALPAWATYTFTEEFAAPPLTAGTPGLSWTDGWNNGDNGWEISEGIPNTAGYNTFGQRSDGVFFTGGDGDVASMRSYPNAATAAAIQYLPAAENLTSGNVTLSAQNMITSWGSSTSIILVGEVSGGSLAYAGIIRFGNSTGTDDRIYVDETWGYTPIADASTLTSDGKVLKWNTSGFNPLAGNYATLSVDFNLSAITVTVSTTDAAGNTSSAAPVSFATYNPVLKFTKVGLFMNPTPYTAPASGGLIYLSDFTVNAVPEPATLMILAAGGLLLRRCRR